MTIDYGVALTAIRQNSATQLRQAFDGLTLRDAVELGTFVGPRRLQAVTFVSRGDVAMLLGEINRQAFHVPLGAAAGQPLLILLDQRIKEQVRLALLDVARRHRVGPLLNMPSDVTATLPSPTQVPPPLNDSDYEVAARRQSVELAMIKAVAIVESGGAGFDERGRPKILFEAHKFGPLTGNRFGRTHPHLSLTEEEWRGSRRYYSWNQYQRLHEAMVLDLDAALMAASWGKFQVLGSNHNGWQNVRGFVPAMYVSEANHLRAFEAYCVENHLMHFIRKKDWLSFARGYNGRGQEGYDGRIRNAYQRLSQRSAARIMP